MHPIIILLILVFIIGPILIYLCNKSIDKQRLKNNSDITVKTIKEYSTGLAEALNDSFKIDYNKALLEEYFFFYFLFVVKTVDFNLDEDVCYVVENKLFSTFNNLTSIGYSLKDIFIKRKTIYSDILKKHDLKCTSNFFYEIFEYQSKQITDNPDTQKEVNNFLKENISEFQKFYNTYY